jgi:hypothetical protein
MIIANDKNRELLERGYDALNKFYQGNMHDIPKFIPYHGEEIPNVVNVSLEDLDFLRRIKEEMIKYPFLNISDIKKMFPSLDTSTIHKYIGILDKVDDESLFGSVIQSVPEMYHESIGDKISGAFRNISKIPGQISDWFTRMRNIIPSASTIYKSLKLIAENNPNKVLGAKVLFGMALVALGTYGAKKIYDYVFKNDKTIENEELGLPKPEDIETSIPLTNITPLINNYETLEEESSEDIYPKDDIPPIINPIELIILENTMETPENIKVDHSKYIKKKIDMLLRSNINRNREWEPFTYRMY